MAKKDRNGLDAFLTATEAIADTVMNGDLIASIPVVGLAWKSAKALDDVRDRLFAAKISRFMSGMGELSDSQKEAMKAALIEHDDVEKVGEVVLLTLEQVSDLNKATLMGSIFRLYIDNQLSGEDLRRLANMINLAFWDDLSKFIWGECDAQCQRRLSTAGLYSVSGGMAHEGSCVSIFFTVADLGMVLQKLQRLLRQI